MSKPTGGHGVFTQVTLCVICVPAERIDGDNSIVALQAVGKLLFQVLLHTASSLGVSPLVFLLQPLVLLGV